MARPVDPPPSARPSRPASGAGSAALDRLLAEVRACRHCEAELPLGPRPVLVAHRRARLLIAGQAPGTKVHASGIPWDDASGERLRRWLDLPPATFYDPRRVAIVPMGFCYPGRGAGGDLPPLPACRERWHDRVLAELPCLRLKVVIGQYAVAYHLRAWLEAQPALRRAPLAEVVAQWQALLPLGLIALPHPSPRNQRWLRQHAWFEAEVVPALQAAVRAALAAP